VAIGFVTGMLSGMRTRGENPDALLRTAGISVATIDDPGARVPLRSYAALYQSVTQHLDDEGFALFSTPMRPGAFEFLCRGMIGSPSLGVALARCSRYLAVVLPDLSLEVDWTQAAARLRIVERRAIGDHRDDARRVFAFEWLLRLVHGLACWLVARSLSLSSVAFPFARPAHADDYALIYTANSSFDATALEASFQANLLDLPIRRDDAALESFLQGGPETLTMLYRRDRETVRQVRDALAAALPASPVIDDIAAAMHLSPRTLHRRLVQEGSSFRAIKDALRRDIALARLERENVPVSQLAHDLGFTDTSAFFRAFRKWTGQAPSRYRSRH
jgi:AraC-like DNA-binding protein